MRRFLGIFLCIIVVTLSFVKPIHADVTGDIVISAYGYICDIPGGFTLTYINDYTVQLDWIPGNGSISTMIRSAYNGYPVNISDGSLVYVGNGSTCLDSVNMIDNNLYYRAWGQNSNGVWTVLYVEKEGNFMSLSYMWMGLIFLCFIGTFFAFKTTAVLFRIGAAATWLTLILFVFSSDKTLVFTNGWVISLFMSIFCMVVGILLLYVGKEIDKGWIINRKKDKRSNSQIRQDAYRMSLRQVTSKKRR